MAFATSIWKADVADHWALPGVAYPAIVHQKYDSAMEHQHIALSEDSANHVIVREEIPPIIAAAQPSNDESGRSVDEYEKSRINAARPPPASSPPCDQPVIKRRAPACRKDRSPNTAPACVIRTDFVIIRGLSHPYSD